MPNTDLEAIFMEKLLRHSALDHTRENCNVYEDKTEY